MYHVIVLICTKHWFGFQKLSSWYKVEIKIIIHMKHLDNDF